SRSRLVEECILAVERDEERAAAVCELAWLDTRDEAAAVAGAHHALKQADEAALRRWADRARPTIQGARILHFWGCLQRSRGDLAGAEQTLRRVLELRIDRDPARATNTAIELLKLVQSYRPAEQSIELALTAWEQADLGHVPLSRAMAAHWLSELLIDLGELRIADLVIQEMDTVRYRPLRDHAEGRLQAARGWHEAAVALFRRASAAGPETQDAWRRDAMIDLVHALLEQGQTREARRVLDEAIAVAEIAQDETVNAVSRLAAAKARVALEEGDIERALKEVEEGLARPSRDSARVLLLRIRGDAYARSYRIAAAELAWADAADEIEQWRASIPSIDLRAELLGHHSRALESWLESAAARGDLDEVLEVIPRMSGRHRPVAEISSDGTSLRSIVERMLANRLAVSRLHLVRRNLRDVSHDLVVIMSGLRSVWAVRRAGGVWSISRVGDREAILMTVDEYRSDPDHEWIAAALGEAMFPADTIPKDGKPLVVLLGRELADIPLAGLRSGGRYLVEYAPIFEVLAPDQLFVPQADRAWGRAVAFGDSRYDLPAARREALAVAQAFAGQAYLGMEATPDAIAGGASAWLMHLAVHSQVAGGRAVFRLAGGELSAREIVEHRIAPRLAVIATCRSHVDDNPSASLAAAFLAAGTTGVIAVKRSLNDEAGARLIRDFYALGGAADPAASLARAQRAAIQAKRPPSEWAIVSFFGVGGWIPTERRP
ncbi:MAG TPA: CHAT domain-containing protein, partial [Kofleriaceae bacterium]|nr:CHAT domain-containing protein [Kofleriaceae bacterium]